MILQYDPFLKEYWFDCQFEQNDIPRQAGFTFNHARKRWLTQSPQTALRLFGYANKETKEALEPIVREMKETYEKSFRLKTDLVIPTPLGFSLADYQKVGVEFMLDKEAVLLGDDMGLGKTIQVISLINVIVGRMRAEIEAEGRSQKKFFSGLIVCPASLKLNWAKEFGIWLDKKLTYTVITPAYYASGADILIINYDLLHKYLNRIHQRKWNIVVFDECHYIKSPLTKRTKAAQEIVADRKVGMTGTPMPNRPYEVIHIANILDPTNWGNLSDNVKRYCGGVVNGKVQTKGASNMKELHYRLRSSLMIRRTKDEVLTELPDKRRQIIELPAQDPATQAIVDAEREAYDKQAAVLLPLKQAVEAAKAANDTDAYKAALKTFHAAHGQILGQIATLRKQVAVAKLPMLIPHLENCIESVFKVVVFCHHHEVMDAIKKHFGKYAVKFSGQETLQERQSAVESFQNSSGINLFIGSLTAAGVGITLTASSHAVFAELDWVPGTILQAEDRLHRIGQKNSVLIQHTVLEKSLDLRIAAQLIAKLEVANKVLDNK